MRTTPNTAILGPMELVSTFEEDYDGPPLMLYRNSAGQEFLAAWTEERIDQEKWLYAPLSEDNKKAILSGAKDIRDAFTHGSVFHVTQYRNGSESQATQKQGASLNDDLLPPAGDRLDPHLLRA